MIPVLLLLLNVLTAIDFVHGYHPGHGDNHQPTNELCPPHNQDACSQNLACKWAPPSQCLQRQYRLIDSLTCNEGTDTEEIETLEECKAAIKFQPGSAKNDPNFILHGPSATDNGPSGCYVDDSSVVHFNSRTSSDAVCTEAKKCLCAIKNTGNNPASGQTLIKTDPTCANIPNLLLCQSSGCEWKDDKCISFNFMVVKTSTCQGKGYQYVITLTSFLHLFQFK